ncbi:MAG: putative toxin-antitoxin system toxin component, PIN family [Saprospiraceae bacterium]|nr:putative toxin-antitoxin system toxin component, PIN family [Saprospiraceae bacterium]
MRVVLDTNVLLVSIPFGTPYYPIFDAFLNGGFELCVTTDILSEYAEKLQEKYSLRPSVAENTLKAIENSPDTVQISKYFFWNLIREDPDDNKFVDCAIAANADFIVTEDRHFKALKDIAFPSVPVISADDFLELLTGTRLLKN